MKKILVIEDTIEVRENICEILELSGYKTTSAKNGKEGVKAAQEEEPDLIICDVMMPELDGFGVLKILSRSPKTFAIPFIFLTARAEKEDLRKGMGLGADDYLTKPFDDTDLLNSIESRLKKAESVHQKFDRSEAHLHSFISAAKAEADFENLTTDREIRKYSKKDTIFEEGQFPRWLYFIVMGSVKNVQINNFGKELIISICKPGDFFGHLPLLNESNYKHNAVSLEDTVLRLIPKNDFTALLHSNRDFAAKFIKMIANEVEQTEEQLIEMAYSSVRRKVAVALLTFIDDDNGFISASREDLASRAGTAKETLIRTLSDFKSEGLIAIEGKKISILNASLLEDMPQ